MATCKDHLKIIENVASEKWGDRWRLELARIFAAQENLKPNARKSQIDRAFEAGSCTVDTLIRLYQAIGYELSISKQLIP